MACLLDMSREQENKQMNKMVQMFPTSARYYQGPRVLVRS